MTSLVHSRNFSPVFRTAEKNSPAPRGKIQQFFGLFPDFVLFYFILIVDAALTAGSSLRRSA